eukprot:CAMPEP_0201283688 /NCGR_PEP_ID=MMETSP1317-20130820/39247_1 /ASSEMBLY_ACC=CAM_ASM_000770 /TAXON_ID=187299 /ORGANISM="Undescribed Undescribed, Strain Undescribed" /LENGTH=82 /DNA_ID=CAMNT_0047600835 /DNA_START=46 /DNA_END=294 /DNA_ORIENTATION=+
MDEKGVKVGAILLSFDSCSEDSIKPRISINNPFNRSNSLSEQDLKEEYIKMMVNELELEREELQFKKQKYKLKKEKLKLEKR